MSWGAIASKGGGFLKFWCFQNLETYPKYSWVTDKIQKKFSDELICYFETYTRYYWVENKEQKKGLRFSKW